MVKAKKGGRIAFALSSVSFSAYSKALFSLFAASIVVLNLSHVYRRVTQVDEKVSERKRRLDLPLRFPQDTTRRLFRNEEGETEITFSLKPPPAAEEGDGDDDDRMWVEVMSWSPRAFVLHNVLSHEQCDGMIKASLPSMESALVEGGDVTEWRTNTQRWVRLEESRKDKNFRRLIKQAALISGYPEVNQELVQILRYQSGEYYMPHYDSLKNIQDLQGQAQRVMTILFYLSDVDKGGETVFPKGKLLSEYMQRNPADLESECDQNAVKPRKGDAVLFFSLDESSVHVDMQSIHGSCPVEGEGEKWGATVWVHTKSFFGDDFGLH